MMEKAIIEMFYSDKVEQAAMYEEYSPDYNEKRASAIAYAIVLEDDIGRAYRRVKRDIEAAIAIKAPTTSHN